MDVDELIQSRFAQENIRAYYRCWRRLLLEQIFAVVLCSAMLLIGYNFTEKTSEMLEFFILLIVFISVFLGLYFLYLSIPIIKIHNDIKNKDIVFDEIYIETAKTDNSGIKAGSFGDVSNLYPNELRVSKTNFYFYDSYGNKKKIRMITSLKKELLILRKYGNVQKKPMPVFYLRTSGLVLAIMDENVSSQQRLYYKTLNCMI